MFSTGQTRYTMEHQNSHPDIDLCDLLQAMKLNAPRGTSGLAEENEMMSVIPEDQNYLSDGGSESSHTNATASHEDDSGCAYLRIIRSQLNEYPTTSGEYLDAIFTHREMFSAHPHAHRECARAFTDIAYMLEKRAWRADRDADIEAVSSFRYEAWMISASLNSISPQMSNSLLSGSQSLPCTMPLM